MASSKIPECVLRNIATYLEYNDRVSMNVAIRVHEYQYVKKMNSDAHHIKYTTEITAKLLDDLNSKKTRTERSLAITKILEEQGSNRSTLLLKYPRYRQEVIDKCNEFLHVNFNTNGIDEKIIKSIRNAAQSLLGKIETIQPSEEMLKIKRKFVEII